jgi:hypothetical protein
MVLLLAGWAAGFVVSDRGLEVKDGFRVCGKAGTAAPLAGLAAFTTVEAPFGNRLSGGFTVSPVAAREEFLAA